MICETKHCRGVAKHGSTFCPKCISRKWRMENPVRSAYLNLKHNAIRRGKEFGITFDEFREFAVKSGYMKKKGRFSQSWHIDRIDESLGYTIDNIQVLTNRQNVRKYLQYYWNGHRMEFSTRVAKPAQVPATVPF